jgi:hypothetical protein
LNVTQAKERNFRNQHLTNQILSLTIEVFGCLHKQANVFLLEEDKRPSSFYLCHFFSSKNFNHISKDANVFNLKSCDCCKFNYFPTSTLSKHTSHHHGLLQVVGFLHVKMPKLPQVVGYGYA